MMGVEYDEHKNVNLVSVESLMPNLIKRRFQLTQRDAQGNPMGETKHVTHLQYLSWPDFGAPEE